MGLPNFTFRQYINYVVNSDGFHSCIKYHDQYYLYFSKTGHSGEEKMVGEGRGGDPLTLQFTNVRTAHWRLARL